MAPKDALPPKNGADPQVAGGRPIGVGSPTFADAAAQLFDNGYEPLPIVTGKKRPVLSRWSTIPIDLDGIDDWSHRYPHAGVGLRTGKLVGVDIDILDADLADRIERLARERLGSTLLRVGRWPKRLLVYRTDQPHPKRTASKLEVLGLGQQFVAFGLHPDTSQPYYWPCGETPLGVPLQDLPLITDVAIESFLAEAAALLPIPAGTSRRRLTPVSELSQTASAGVLREDGLVIDGRDSWLSSIAYHTVLDARDAGQTLDAASLTARVWVRFAATTDLNRPRQGRALGYTEADAQRKVTDKLRLLGEGRLPEREIAASEPVSQDASVPLSEAREALGMAISNACREILDWHKSTDGLPAPQIGIRASVGLGKSTTARANLLELRAALIAMGVPDRIAVFTPSHALAGEAAGAWRQAGLNVAVLHGYQAQHPVMRAPMCQDLEAVQTAIEAGADVHGTACDDGKGHQCAFFETCLKQQNRREIAEADVIFAAYDALWSGFAIEESSLGVIVVDEACWPRAARETRGIFLERFAQLNPHMNKASESTVAALADLAGLRGRATRALKANGSGALKRQLLIENGLTADDCRLATGLERDQLRDLLAKPGATPTQRVAATAIAARNAQYLRYATLWAALARFLEGNEPVCGRVTVRDPDPSTGVHEIVVTGVQTIHATLRDKPVLHLDATLRPELARTILPRLRVTDIMAEAPHMTLRLVTGGFGKSALIANPKATDEEIQRRAHKLDAVVTHVAWEARRVAPGRVLVITYKDCEAAFEDIPGVETAHFNAIAGLDAWGDVALLCIIGRPLPAETALQPLTGAFFGRVAQGGYHRIRSGIRLRDGSTRGVSTIAHTDTHSETLRAAICDDEVIQAIGRGRGVNRSATTPLEVQVFGDVALPLTHDTLAPWDLVAPDVVQRMLLAGLAVDSPADAARLHPGLLINEKQAQKAFERAAFKRQIHIRDLYRGMSLKSAAYRRPGRGKGWQRAFWIEDDADTACETLTRVLGPLDGWHPDQP